MPVTLVQQRYSFITDKYTKNVSWCHVLADPHIQAKQNEKLWQQKKAWEWNKERKKVFKDKIQDWHHVHIMIASHIYLRKKKYANMPPS